MLPFNESIMSTRPSMLCRTVPMAPDLSLSPGSPGSPPGHMAVSPAPVVTRDWAVQAGASSHSPHLSLITAVTTQHSVTLSDQLHQYMAAERGDTETFGSIYV